MNLNARVKGHKIELRQTPTQISYMITATSKGETGGTLTGEDAKRALWSYIYWVNYGRSGVITDMEEYKIDKEIDQEHIKYIKSFLNKKSLEVWVM